MRFATASVRPSLQRVVSRLTCSPTRRASVRVSVRHFDGKKGEEVCHFCSICSRRNTNATAHVRSERDSRRPRKTQVQSVRLPPELTHRLKPNVAVYLGGFFVLFFAKQIFHCFSCVLEFLGNAAESIKFMGSGISAFPTLSSHVIGLITSAATFLV